MSFDYLIKTLWISNYFENFSKSEDKQEKNFAIKRYFKHVEGAKKMVVILPARNNALLLTKFLCWRINRSGSSCLYYSFPNELLSPDTKSTLKGFMDKKEEIRRDISEVKDNFGYEDVDLVAPSLGVVSAMLIANDNKDINRLFLVVPGSCLAASLWHGIRTQKLKKIYEKNGIDCDKLQELWKELAPKNNIDSLQDKSINVYISKSDKVIPYEYGKEFADCLVGKCKKLKVEENPILGHYLSVVKFYFFNKF